MTDSVGGAGDQNVGLGTHRVVFTTWARGSCAVRNSLTISTNRGPFSSGARCLASATRRLTQMGQVFAQIIGRGQEGGVFTEDGERRLSHALDQVFGEARDGLGVVAAGRMAPAARDDSNPGRPTAWRNFKSCSPSRWRT